MSSGVPHSLGAVLADSATRWAEEPVVRSGGHTYRYRELHGLSKQVQSLLTDRGVRPGDRVAWMLPNSMEAAVVCYATLGIGAVSVPVSPLLREREIAHYLRDSGACLLFATPQRCTELASVAADLGVTVVPVDEQILELCPTASTTDNAETVEPHHAAFIIYTSGTTGKPKGVVLSHANLMSNVRVAAELNQASPGDVIYGGLPLTHIFGQSCALHCAVLTGASVMLEPRFDAATLHEAIGKDEVSVLVGVPSMFVSLLTEMDAARIERIDSALKVIVSGGAALPLDVLESIESRLGVVILESYGLTEAAGYVLSESEEHVEADRLAGNRIAGSVGTPVPGCSVRIVDDQGTRLAAGSRGELQVRGRNVMLGYWNNSAATRASFDGDWLKTGDVAYRDESGRHFIVGRSKDLIVRGGYNVYPREVEEVLHAHPLVREIAVLGVPDDQLGEEVVAAVVLHGVEDEPALRRAVDELTDYAKENLAAYKYPRRVKVFPELPKGSNGKILKVAIPQF